MTIPKDLESLTALFAKLGAREPDSWAQSQVNEGIPQLQRFLFLRQAWKSVLSENDTSWIDEEIAMAERYPTGPYAGTGTALKDCLAKGVERQSLVDIVRGAQAQILFQLCYLLDDPNIDVPELVDMSWGLFQTDDDGNPEPPRDLWRLQHLREWSHEEAKQIFPRGA